MPAYDSAFVSPHADDAVFSAGGLIALRVRAGQRVAVVTVFSRGPDDDARRREDGAAVALLGAERIDLGWPEVAARRSTPRRTPDLSDADSPLVARLGESLDGLAGQIVGPLGVANHADHQTVFRACAALPGGVAFYEDMPYALLDGESAGRLADLAGARRHRRGLREQLAAARWWLGRPALAELAPCPLLPLVAWRAAAAIPPPLDRPLPLDEERHDVSGTLELKMAAIAAYRSQWPRFFGSLAAFRGALSAHARRLGSPFAIERLFVR